MLQVSPRYVQAIAQQVLTPGVGWCSLHHHMGNELLTTSQIADRTGWDRTTVHRRLEALGVEPVMVAGRTRLFAASAVDLLGMKSVEGAA